MNTINENIKNTTKRKNRMREMERMRETNKKV
jgi:hypothetical protein